jgi:hypothetical protein
MTKRLDIQEKERRWRIRHIQVISQFAKCNCGKIIPYGHIACKGHSTKLNLSSRQCSNCESKSTYVDKHGYSRWYHLLINEKYLCHKCRQKQHYMSVNPRS